MAFEVELINSLARVDAAAWDALVSPNDPFGEHAFLRALETSESVGTDTGWLPCHLLLRDGGALVGALPLYVKEHSYGEYIFDWGWAGVANRVRVHYYPKLVSMVPFTPATTKRILVAPGPGVDLRRRALIDAARRFAADIDASSAHLLFLEEEEDAAIDDTHYLTRTTTQFHWHSSGEATFDEFLARMRHDARKQIRRERRVVATSGLRVEVREGPSMDDADWAIVRDLYFDTCERKGSGPYLTPGFFDELRATHAKRVVAALAYDGAQPVAMALAFERGEHLYGRYWGSRGVYPMLHFELCYYAFIERAIARGHKRFEAGAQGAHKLKRGLMPSPVRSRHAILNPLLSRIVAEHLARERLAASVEIDELSEHGPFRRSEDSPG